MKHRLHEAFILECDCSRLTLVRVAQNAIAEATCVLNYACSLVFTGRAEAQHTTAVAVSSGVILRRWLHACACYVMHARATKASKVLQAVFSANELYVWALWVFVQSHAPAASGMQ